MANDQFVFSVDTMKPINDRCVEVFGQRSQGSKEYNKMTISLVFSSRDILLAMLDDSKSRVESDSYE